MAAPNGSTRSRTSSTTSPTTSAPRPSGGANRPSPTARSPTRGRCRRDRTSRRGFLQGRDDRLFPLDFQRRVVTDRLGIEVEEVPGGHLVALSQPATLADRLDAMVAGSA